MLKKLLNVFRARGTLMFFIRPFVKIGIYHFQNSRSIRNLVESADQKLSTGSIITTTSAAKKFKNSIIYVDIGARGGSQKVTNKFNELLHFVVFDADPESNAKLQSDFKNSKVTVVNNAISDSDSKRTLFLTESRACSSLLEPSGHSLSLRGGNSRDLTRFKVEREVVIDTQTLSKSIPIEIKFIDILKIDIQGLEYEAISGLGLFRPFLICVECSTVELYLGQKSVFEVGAQLEKLGYMPLKFMEIQLVPKTLANYQSCIPVHGDVIFVPNNSAHGRAIIERDVEKWFASLCMHGYMDFALWQIEELKISKPPLVTETEELLRKS
jgi:FkbM family methyltransferase